MSQPQLSDDERAMIGLAQDIELAQTEAGKWATLAERSENNAMEKIADHFKEVWVGVIEEASESAEELDIDEDALREKLGQPPEQL